MIIWKEKGLFRGNGGLKTATTPVFIHVKRHSVFGLEVECVYQSIQGTPYQATQRINAYRDKCFAIQDYSAAIENMLLAIVELGYQSCLYEGHITDDVKKPIKKSFEERAWFNAFGNVE